MEQTGQVVETKIQAVQQSQPVKFTPEQVELVKRTVAKGATNDELQMFMYLAERYNLDPFQKEIWFIKYDRQSPTIMTSRDGYLKIAQENEDFIGLISFVVKEGDTFSIDAANYAINHQFGTKRGAILGAWAKCERKGRTPVVCFVDFNEYNQNSPTWKKYPSAMIQKVAEVFVLKRQFGINGLVTKEEMDAGEVEAQVIEPIVNKSHVDSLLTLVAQKGHTERQLRAGIYKAYGISEVDELTINQYKQVMHGYESLPDVEELEEDKNKEDVYEEPPEELVDDMPPLTPEQVDALTKDEDLPF